MVGTRHSLPAAEDARADTSSPPPSTMSKKARAALKKLQIDGKGALLGEKLEQEATETYHWRGAAYAVTKNTKVEWIQGQPPRYQKQKEKRKRAASEGGIRERDSTPIAHAKKSGGTRKVRFGSLEESARRKDDGGRKRKRSMADADEGRELQHQIKKPRSMGARKTAYTPSPPSKSARRGGAPSSRQAFSVRKRRAVTPPAQQPKSPLTPPSEDDEKTRAAPARPTRAQKDNKLLLIKQHLVAIARINTRRGAMKTSLKKIFLQQRLRELRSGGGNQLSFIPDPRAKHPRPEAAPPPPDITIKDDEKAPAEHVPRTSPPASSSTASSSSSSSSSSSRPTRSTTSPDHDHDSVSSKSSSPPSSPPKPDPSFPSTTTTSASFSLTNHLTNDDRAESQIYSSRRASSIARGKEGRGHGGQETRGMRKRRVAREMDAVRNLWEEDGGEAGVGAEEDV